MRRLLVVGFLLAALLSGCGTPAEEVTSGSTTTAGPGAGWEQLPPSPLSPRGRAVLVDLGDAGLLVVGGDMVADCRDMRDAPADEEASGQSSGASSGPTVLSASTLSCVAPERDPRLSDGAILDSPTGEWRRTADAPAPLSDLSTGVVIGDTVYFWSWPSVATNGPTEGTWMSYDVSDDAWTRLAAPPSAYLRVVRAGDRILGFHGSEERGPVRDLVYDPATDSWSELARDPLSPSFDRFMVWTGREVVLLANELVPNPGSERPSLVRAAAYDPGTEQWRRLQDSETVGGYDTWWWSGGRVVNAVQRSSDGGETNNWGRDYPYGGVLDPATGEWSALPPERPATPECAKEKQSWDMNLGYQAAGPDIVVHDSLALHVSKARWELVPCNPPRADFKFASTWALGGLVAFGGYDEFHEPGKLIEYQFSNSTWLWRPPNA